MFSKSIKKPILFKSLAADRQMTSLIDKEIIADGGAFTYLRSDWVALYFDSGNVVVSDDGSQSAYRAITTCGEKLWLVFSEGKTRGYHAESDCPFEAFEEARDALTRRRAIRADWDNIKALAQDLRMRRVALDIHIDDAVASPLCAMGTRHFLRRLGMSKVTRISGFKLAWLMLLEPQLGFVIDQAASRQHAKPMRRATSKSLNTQTSV